MSQMKIVPPKCAMQINYFFLVLKLLQDALYSCTLKIASTDFIMTYACHRCVGQVAKNKRLYDNVM